MNYIYSMPCPHPFFIACVKQLSPDLFDMSRVEFHCGLCGKLQPHAEEAYYEEKTLEIIPQAEPVTAE